MEIICKQGTALGLYFLFEPTTLDARAKHHAATWTHSIVNKPISGLSKPEDKNMRTEIVNNNHEYTVMSRGNRAVLNCKNNFSFCTNIGFHELE
jgi:hypothetical protein